MNLKWAIFVSGRGSNAIQFILDSCLSGSEEVKLVLSSKPGVIALQRAKRCGVMTITLDKTIDWDNVSKVLESYKINRIFLLGFMKIVPTEFLSRWQGRIYNLHPSLLPLFKGKDAIQRSYLSRSSMGVSVHHVTPGMDEGEVIKQKIVISREQKKVMNFDQIADRIALAEQILVGNVRKAL